MKYNSTLQHFRIEKTENLQKMRRTLLFMPEYVMGGAETQFRYLIEYAERTRWKLDVIVEHRFQRKDPLLEQDIARMKNVRFYEFEGCGNDQKRIIQCTIHYMLVNVLKTKYSSCLIHYAPDIVLAPILKTFGIRVIYSERVDAANIIADQYWTKCLRYCSGIVANSRHSQRRLESLTGRRIRMIRNGKPIVKQLARKETREIQRILVPARIVSHKNQLLMLRYLKEHPGFVDKIIFAGAVEDEGYQRKLISYINRHRLNEKVEFLGYVKNMRSEYEKSDLVVLPSLSEGTPNVVLEAYAYGRPVIVSDIPAEREIVTDPCLRFKCSNPYAVDQCIMYVQNMAEDKYDQMIWEHWNFVVKKYGIERMVKQFQKMMW